MKVMILANNDIGLYKFRRELIEALLVNHKVCICLPYGKYVDQLKNMGCRFIACEFDRHGTNVVNEVKLMHFYKNIFRTERPDIVLTYTIKPNVYGGMMCSGLGIPYVTNITGLGTAVENEGMLQRVTLLLYKCGLRKAQHVFFQNQSNADFLSKKVKIKMNSSVLPGSGVNLQQYRVLEFPDGETVDFVFVGRVMKEKGIDQYLDAAQYIRDKYPYTRFHICGMYEQDYKVQIECLENQNVIIYHGLVHDMTEIYKLAQCTIHPSFYPEGLSNVLLESCASGRPIITTDRPGCREVVDDGVNGWIVRQQDSKDLIRKIEQFISMGREQRIAMGIAGRRKVEREFDRNIVIAQYMKEIEKADVRN